MCVWRGGRWIEGGMAGWLAISRPFQQFFSFVSTMVDDNNRLSAMEPPLLCKRFSHQGCSSVYVKWGRGAGGGGA